MPAIGFALGLERILLALPEKRPDPEPFCFLAPVGPAAQKTALRLAREIRRLGQRAELDGRGRSLKAMLRRADALGARLVAVIGDAELDRDVVAIKDLALHAQQEVPTANAPAHVVQKLSLARAESRPPPPPPSGELG